MGVFFEMVNNVIDTDAKYQNFCQKWEAALLASGFWEVAPDTGQVNLATMTRPGVINTYSGFKIYRVKDPLATMAGTPKPMYMKLEYGIGGTNDRIRFQRSFGTISNGAGTLTGATQVAQQIATPSTTGSGTSYICGGGGEHDAFVWAFDSAQISWCFGFLTGRTMDQDDGSVNAVDSSFYDTYVTSQGSTLGSSVLWTDGSAGFASGGSAGMGEYFPNLVAAMDNGGDVATSLLFQGLIYKNAKEFTFPYLNSRAAETPMTVSDPAAAKFDINVWGQTRTFIPLPFNAHIGGNRYCAIWDEA